MSMNKVCLALLTILAMLIATTTEWGGANFGAEAFAQATGDAAAAKPGGDESAAGTPVDDDEDDDDEEDDDEDDDPCVVDPENCNVLDMGTLAKRDVTAEMYAVQQIWALRARRFEVNLYGGVTVNDQFVAHPGPGLGINYYLNNELAVGVNANVFAGLNATSNFNRNTTRSARIGMPITEYQWNANANVSYVPAYGKLAAFQNFIFHYDFYVLAGGGVISTRPIAVVDPDNRTFKFKVKPTFGAGAGIRIFFTRYLAAMLEIRDYIYFEELENPEIAGGFDANGAPRTQDEKTWLRDGTDITNAVQAQLGLSVFLPLTWQYRLPK
jgi:outer membrane beta-barrel protein